MSERYSTVFFDLDGTLLDSIPGIVASLRYSLQKGLGWAPTDKDLVAGIGTTLDDQLLHHGLTHLGRRLTDSELEQFRTTYIDHNLSTHDATIKSYPGVSHALARLSDAGIYQGIVTSKPQSTARRGLRVCGLEQHFEFVVGYDDVIHPKPHPEPIIKALKLANVGADEAVFVGDSPHDILAGRRAGVATVAAQWGPFDETQLNQAEPTYQFLKIDAFVDWILS